MTTTYSSPLSSDAIAYRAPSVYARTAYAGVSPRYNFLSTDSVINALAYHEILPYNAVQSRTRIEGKTGYVKHVVRFRAPNVPLIVGDTLPEIILTNSHDRASTFSLELGLFRLVCSNGLTTSSVEFQSYKIRHVLSSSADVIDAVQSIVRQFPALTSTVETWNSRILSIDQQNDFAEKASLLRWDTDKAPFSANRLLAVRRREDREPTLWNTYNRIQENIIQGMPRYPNTSGRYGRGSRAVTGLDNSQSINRELWALAESFA